MNQQEPTNPPPRIVALRVRNFRVFKSLELKDLRPLSVFLGPNGSGKSTVLDVFAFLSECFTNGLRHAWDRRNRFREMLSRGSSGPVEIELKYREYKGSRQLPLVTYHLAIGEKDSGPFVEEEWLQWKRKPHGRPFRFLDFRSGGGGVVSGELPDEDSQRTEETLDSPDALAVNTLGQFAKHPRVSALRRFITGWHLSYLTADHTRSVPESGPQERLSQTGDNLPNVIQYLRERHPQIYQRVCSTLAKRVPRLEKVDAALLEDGRLLLQIKDAPFERPILSKYASDGTLKMLAYLLVLMSPHPSPFIGIEEPENHLHPGLLSELAEECREATTKSQLLVTTHSPYFINALRPEEVWVLHRGSDGFAQATRADQMPNVASFIEEGAQLGDLWTEKYFPVGYPADK